MLGQVKGIGTILFHRILPMLSDDMLDEAMRKVTHSFRFPDGSIYLEVPDHPTHLAIVAPILAEPILEGRVEVQIYRSLAAFPLVWYGLHYPMAYQDMLDEAGFGAGVGSAAKTWPGERKLDRLQFTTWFKQTPEKPAREAFRDTISGWCASVATHGVDGEGPVASADPEITYRGKRADIVLDATRSGPNTLNYLILVALEFGHSVAVVENAMFNQDDPESLATLVAVLRKVSADAGREFDEYAYHVERLGGSGPVIRLPITC